jgi:hypothetical protein
MSERLDDDDFSATIDLLIRVLESLKHRPSGKSLPNKPFTQKGAPTTPNPSIFEPYLSPSEKWWRDHLPPPGTYPTTVLYADFKKRYLAAGNEERTLPGQKVFSRAKPIKFESKVVNSKTLSKEPGYAQWSKTSLGDINTRCTVIHNGGSK